MDYVATQSVLLKTFHKLTGFINLRPKRRLWLIGLLIVSAVQVQAQNNDPVITSTAVTSVLEGETYNYSPTATDADNDALTFTATTKPSWLTLRTPDNFEVSTIAGNGSRPSPPLNGTGTSATFLEPEGLVTDSNGNIYVVDTNHRLIRKITPQGVVSTLAGQYGASNAVGVDGTGTSAIFMGPTAIAINSSDLMYVADNSIIRTVTTAGVVSTFAGNNDAGNTATDFPTDGTGTAANFHEIDAMVVDANGNLFVGDKNNINTSGIIRKVTPAGVVTTLAGGQTGGTTGGTGTTAQFAMPRGMDFDSQGVLHFADASIIYNMDASNVVTPIAGSTGGAQDIDGTGTSARFNFIRGIALDSKDDIYVVAGPSQRVRKVTQQGVVTTPIGLVLGFLDGFDNAAKFNQPFGIHIDGNDVFYISDRENGAIRKIVKSPVLLTGDPAGQVGNHNVTLKVDDGNGGTAEQSFVVAVTAANAAPVVDLNGATAGLTTAHNYNENSEIKFATAGTVSDADGDNIVSMTVTITNSTQSNDDHYVAIDFQATAARTAATNAGVTIGFTSNGVTNITGSASAQIYQDILQNLIYGNSSDLPPAETINIEVVVNDGTVNSATASSAITIIPLNDGSSAFGTGANPNFTEGGNAVILFTNMTGDIQEPNTTITGFKFTVTNVTSNAGADEKLTVDGTSIALNNGNTGTTSGNSLSYSVALSGNTATLMLSGGNFTATAFASLLEALTYENVSQTPSADSRVVTLSEVTDSGAQGGGHDNPRTLSHATSTVSVTPVNDPSVFTSATTASFAENGTGTAYMITATDVESFNFTYALGTGNDTDKFNITNNLVTFKTAPDFENPTDADGNNTYIVEVKVTENGLTVMQNVTITVTDVDDTAPVFTSATAVNFAENGTGTAYTVAATDANAVTYSLGTGNDEALFNINGGVVTFKAAPDFETPGDGTGDGSSNTYLINVIATDAGNNAVNQNVTITVTDVQENVAPVFTSQAVTSINQNSLYKYAITTSDAEGDDVTVTVPTIPTWLSITNTVTKGEVTTFAGSGSRGYATGNGTAASFNSPRGVAVDAAGNVYLADSDNHRIRKITPEGEVTDFAGSGVNGAAPVVNGDLDGNGTNATLASPRGLAIDASGNLYVTQINDKIRKITPNGDVTTLAGSGTIGGADGVGTLASFNNPYGIAVDGDGNVYVTEFEGNKIRKITPGGEVSTLAGNGTRSFNDGNGTNAGFTAPSGVAVDAANNVFVADLGNHRIRKITPNGDVTTFAGSGVQGAADGNGTSATLHFPFAITIDGLGNLYVAEQGGAKIRKITTNGDVTTLAGSGTAGSADGIGTNASFNSLQGVAIDAAGNLYVGETNNHKIRKISTSNSYQLTGNPSGQVGDHSVSLRATDVNGGITDQNFTISVFYLNEFDPVISSSPVTSVNDNATYNYLINTSDGDNDDLTITAPTKPNWLSLTTGHEVSTFAGGTFGTADGTGTNAQFQSMNAFATDKAGNIYVPVANRNIIRKVSPSGVVSTFAGSGVQGALDGTGTAAQFNRPTNAEVGPDGNIYISEQGNGRIRKISPEGVVTTFAGSSSGFLEGTGTQAQFWSPQGMAFDAAGNLYVADTGNNRIRKISPAGITTTFAGSTRGSSDGTGTNAQFYQPVDVILDATENVYVSDPNNYRIRKITPAGVVTTFAGSTSGDVDGTGTEAQFGLPVPLEIDDAGNLYVGDRSSDKIRKITPAGVVTTFAGSVDGSEDGLALEARFKFINGLAFDGLGNLFVADRGNYSIRKISKVSVLSGSAVGQSAGNHGVILTADDGNGKTVNQSFTINVVDVTAPVFTSGTGVSFAEMGTGTAYTIAATDINNGITYSLGTVNDEAFFNISGALITFKSAPDFETKNSYTIEVVATDAANNSAKQNVTIAITDVNDPPVFTSNAITEVERSGEYKYEILATDQDQDNLTMTAPTLPTWLTFTEGSNKPNVVTTFAGGGATANADGTGTAAAFLSISAMTSDSNGNVYVANGDNNTIRKITPTGVVTTLATNVANIVALAANGNGDVFAAEATKINKITQAGAVSDFVASGIVSLTDMVIDPTGTLYWTDLNSGSAKLVKATSAGLVTTVYPSTLPPALPAPNPNPPAPGTPPAPPAPAPPAPAPPAPAAGPTVTNVTSTTADGTKLVGDVVEISITFSEIVNVVGTPELTLETGSTDRTILYNGTGSGTTTLSFTYTIQEGDNSTDLDYVYTGSLTLPSGSTIKSAAGSNNAILTLAAPGTTGSLGYNKALVIGHTYTFSNPTTLAIDKDNNLYVVVEGTDIVKFAAGATTFTGFANFSSNLGAIAFGNDGNLYAYETGAFKLQQFDSDGKATVLAGSGSGARTDGIGTAATFTDVKGLAIDPNGNLYVAEADFVRKIAQKPTVMAGTAPSAVGTHNVVLKADDNNGGITEQSFTITVNDVTAPTFSTDPFPPTINATSILMGLGLNEAGKAYYVVLADGATAPTAAEVKAGTGSAGAAVVTSANAAITDPNGSFSHSFDVTGLTENTDYDIYVIAEDAPAGNLQATPFLLEIKTIDGTAPAFSSATTATFAENGTGTAYTVAATDANAVTYTLGTGNDEVLFEINGGVVTFINAPDFESPGDGDNNNTYVINVIATDGANNAANQNVTITVTDVDEVLPVISSDIRSGLNPSANEVDITFSEGVFGGNGTGPVEPSDFTLQLSNNTAVNTPVISAITNTSGQALTGGETVLRVSFGYTGTAKGDESLTFKPAANAIFDAAGNAAATTQTHGTLELHDETFPTITGIVLGEASGTHNSNLTYYIDVSFSEVVSGITLEDFILSLSNSQTTLTHTVTTQGGAALTGSETTVRLNLSFGTGHAEGNTVNMMVANSTIFDRANNPVGVTNLTTTLKIDQVIPDIGFMQVDANNSVLTTFFTEKVFGDANASLPLQIDDLSITVSGGTATGATITSLTNGGGGALTGGEEEVLVNFTLTGTPNGNESVTLDAASLTSIFDEAGFNQHTPQGDNVNKVNLNDVYGPILTSAITINFAENGTGTAYTVAATDANAVTYSLGTGNDEDLFDIAGGLVTFKAAPDFETPTDGNTDNAYVINVIATDASNNTSNQNVTITVTDVDEILPVFTSAISRLYRENGTSLVYIVSANDANALTFALGTGNDEAFFNINEGVLTFKTAPDFENPADGDQNNDYVIEVQANDGLNTAKQIVTITVTDVDEILPVFTSATTASFAENATGTAYTPVATDANEVTYTLGTGNDETLFSLKNGVVSFVNIPDFEKPRDTDRNNTYIIEVQANDGLNTASQTVTITVTDVDEIDPVFTSATTATFAENGTGTAYTISATDANVVTYSLGTGNDEGLFDITGGLVTFKNAPDFENPADANTDNAYVINVIAMDAANNAVNQNVTITVTNVDDTAPVFSSATTVNFAENGTGTAYTISATDANAVTYSLGTGNDESLFDITGGLVTFKNAPDFENPADANTDNAYVINVIATDAANNAVNQNVTITVTDVIEDVTGPVLTASNPADEAVDFAGTTITFTFDENIVKGVGRISVFDAANDTEISGAGVGSPRVTVNGNTATFDLINALPLDKQVYVRLPVGVFKDALNNTFNGILDKTTLNFASASTPKLTASNPVDDAVDVSGSTVTFTFDRNMVKGTGRISVFDASNDSEITGAGVGSARVSITNNVVTFDLINALPVNKQVYLKIPPSALKDANNRFFLGINDKTTLNFASPTTPQLVSSTPTDEATNVGGTTLTFTFDRNIVKGAGRISVFDAADDSEITGAGVGSARVTVTNNVVTFDLVNPLPFNKQVYVRIPASALKDGNNSLFQGITDKTTLNFASPTTPQLVSSTPVDEATNAGGTTLTFTFDRNVVKGSGRISIYDAANDTEINGAGVGSARVSIVNNVVTYDLVNALPLDKEFYVRIPASAFKDVNNVFYQGMLDKTTLNFASPTTPQLLSSNPADEATEFDGTTITLTFDRNLSKGTGRISVYDAADDSEITGAGVGSSRVTIVNNVVTIDLINPLPLNKQVYVNIPGGALKDVNNQFYKGILDETTLNFSSQSSPQLVSSNPVDEAIDFTSTTITLTFDRNVIKGTGRVQILDAADDTEVTGAGVGSTRISVSNNVVTFDLINPLPLDKQVYLKIPGAAFKDANDVFYQGMLDKTTLNFATPTTPQITSTNPLDGTTDFSGTTITFTFDRDVMKGTGRLSVFNAADDTEITGAGVGSTRVTVTNNLVTFDLINTLPAGTSVYVKVPASAFKDANDRFYKGMLDKTTLNFSTVAPPPLSNQDNGLGELNIIGDVEVRLYPNPVNQVVTLDLSKAGEEPDVRITDVTGAQKFSLEKVQQKSLSIDVSQYAGGIYIAIIRTSEGQLIRKKFMIKR